MRSNKSYFLMCWLTTLVISCSSPLKNELMFHEIIQFEGFVTPIRIPIQLEYKPAAVEFKAIISVDKKDKDEGKVLSLSLDGHFEISRLGDKLLWDFKITKMKTGNKVYSPKNPIVDARLLTDSHGKVIEYELALPGIDRSKIEDAKYFEIYNGWEKKIKNNNLFFNRFIFPDHPVKSGDLIYGIPSKQIEDFLGDLHEPLRSGLKGIRDINQILNGWIYYEGEKALLTSVNDELFIEDPRFTGKVSFKVSGYSILDKNCFQHIKTKLKIVFSDKNYKDGIYLLIDYSATLK